MVISPRYVITLTQGLLKSLSNARTNLYSPTGSLMSFNITFPATLQFRIVNYK